jgi:hypothetical protein
MVSWSRNAPRQDFPEVRPQTQRNVDIAGVSAAHRDAKPGTGGVEVLNRAQSPAEMPIIEMCVGLELLRYCSTGADLSINCAGISGANCLERLL